MRSIAKKIIMIILVIFLCLCASCANSKKIVDFKAVKGDGVFTRTYYVDDDVPYIPCYVYYDDGTIEGATEYQTSITKFSEVGQIQVIISYKGFTDKVIFNVNERLTSCLKVELKDETPKEAYCFNDYNLFLVDQAGNKRLIEDYYAFVERRIKDNDYEVIFKYLDYELITTIKLCSDEIISLDVPQNGINSIKISDASLVINDVHYGGDRKTNYIVYYDQSNRINTNEFGYELLVDECGIVVEGKTNIELEINDYTNCTIISGHGEGANLLRNKIKIGSYVYFDKASGRLFVFDKENEFINYLKFDFLFKIIDELISDYNALSNYKPLFTLLVNKVISEANRLFIEPANTDATIDNIDTLAITAYWLRGKIKQMTAHKENLIYLNNNVLSFNEINNVKFNFTNPLKVTTITVNHSGGYRATNEVVHYDKTNLANRNEFGYEIAVSSDGLIVDLGINVDLPEDGFIISGHGSGKEAIIANCRLNDKVEYIDGSINIYRDPYTSKVALYKAQIEELINYVNDAYKNCVPLYYGSLHSTINKAIDELNQINGIVFQNPDSLKSLISFNDSKVEEYIYEASILTLDQNAIGNKAFWYDTAKLAGLGFSDDSVESVDKLLAFVKDEGFNTIYLSVESHGYVLYKSKFLKPMADFYVKDGQYGEYKDYLDSITNLAKKYGISIRIWLKAMVAGDATDIPNNIPTNYLCTDINGNLPSSGHIHFDASNPEVREFIKDIYLEIVNNYDVDGVELDYIRYESSNLSSLKGQITASQINDYSFSEYAINQFMEENNLSGDFTTLFLNDASLRQKWIDYKKDNITEVVKLVSNEVKKVNPNVSVTASVFRYRSKDNVCQDWPKWLEEGYLDNIEPMIYSNDDEYFEKDVVDAYNHLASKYMIVGVGPMVSNGDTYQLIRQIRFLEKYGCGYSVFSAAQMFNDEFLVNAFAKYNNYTLSLKAPKIDKSKVVAKLLLDEINGYYKKVSDFDYSSIINILYMISIDYNEDLIISLIEEVEKIDNELIKNNMLAKINQINVG